VRLFAAAALLLLAGCTIERNGVVHHVIVGFGVVSVNKTNQAAQVTSAKALGVYCSDAPGTKFSAGYLAQTTTAIRTNSNVIVEVK
jgi:hypothetical protein